ncbi:MAG TPA: hypothetical protein DCE41_10100, partial [Cytophagales bacterium]|nr:hypothetical protein [Cytophagales bacterium]
MSSPQDTLQLTTHKHSVRRANLVGLITLATLVTLDTVISSIQFDKPIFTNMDYGTLRLRITFVFMAWGWWAGNQGRLRLQAFLILFGFYSSYLLSPMIEPAGATHPAEHYFVLLAVFIIMAVIPYLLYDLNKDKKILLFWQILIPVTFIGSFLVNLGHFEQTSDAYFIAFTQNNLMSFLGFWGVYVALVFITIQYKRAQQTHYEELQDSNQELEKTLATIDNQNTVLAERQE